METIYITCEDKISYLGLNNFFSNKGLIFKQSKIEESLATNYMKVTDTTFELISKQEFENRPK